MAAETVKLEERGRVLIVRLDNPPRNFMTTAMVRELDTLTRQLEDDASVGAVVITGAIDDVFITHFDVSELSRSSSQVRATLSPTQAGRGLGAVGMLERVPGARAVLGRTPAARALRLRQIPELFP